MDLDVNPCALLLSSESQHFIGTFIRPLGRIYRRSATDKRALKSCVTLLYRQMVYEMCKMCAHVCVCIHNWGLRFAAVTYPSQPSFQYTLKQCWRKFSHIVVLSEAFHWSAPSVPRSIDGCPVSLSQRFRKHQRLSDEVLTKGHRVEAMERREADYWEREAGEKERETGRSEGKSITQTQLSEAMQS